MLVMCDTIRKRTTKAFSREVRVQHIYTSDYARINLTALSGRQGVSSSPGPGAHCLPRTRILVAGSHYTTANKGERGKGATKCVHHVHKFIRMGVECMCETPRISSRE